MSDLIARGPTELTAAELDMVSGGHMVPSGYHPPNISIDVQLNNNISVENAIGLAVLSPGAIVTAANANVSLQGNKIS